MPEKARRTKKVVEPKARAVSREEARWLFDEAAQQLFGISGDEWVRRYDAGEYDEVFEDRRVLDMYFMLPAYRDIPANGRG